MIRRMQFEANAREWVLSAMRANGKDRERESEGVGDVIESVREHVCNVPNQSHLALASSVFFLRNQSIINQSIPLLLPAFVPRT